MVHPKLILLSLHYEGPPSIHNETMDQIKMQNLLNFYIMQIPIMEIYCINQIMRQPIPRSLARAGRGHSSPPTFPILAPDIRDPCDRPRAHSFSFRGLVRLFRASSSSSPGGVRIARVSSLHHIASSDATGASRGAGDSFRACQHEEGWQHKPRRATFLSLRPSIAASEIHLP